MYVAELQTPGTDADLPKDIDKLKRKLEKRNEKISALEVLVARQMALLDRYDQTAASLKNRVDSGGGPVRELSTADYERLIGLLDRAVARAEQLTGDKQQLQSNLEHLLGLLERSMQNQERMSGTVIGLNRSNTVPAAAAGKDLKSTVSQYDAMLERSLSALEAAHKTNRSQQQEIEQRDRYLNQTLEALQNAVRMQERHLSASPSGKKSEPSNADSEAIKATLARYDSMLERSLSALESAHKENRSQQQEIEQRDRYLNQTLDALQNAIRMQESVSQKYLDVTTRQALRTEPSNSDAKAVEATLSRYDAMLERSLSALEKAYQANQEHKKDIEQRDRLLSRTLDALQNLVEGEGEAVPQKERGVLARLFG